jgi:hypothetical protein
MRGLLQIERHNYQEQLPVTLDLRAARLLARSLIVHYIRHTRSVQSNQDQGRTRIEDSFQNSIRTIRVSGHAIRADKRASYILGIHQQCTSEVPRRFRSSLLG